MWLFFSLSGLEKKFSLKLEGFDHILLWQTALYTQHRHEEGAPRVVMMVLLFLQGLKKSYQQYLKHRNSAARDSMWMFSFSDCRSHLLPDVSNLFIRNGWFWKPSHLQDDQIHTVNPQCRERRLITVVWDVAIGLGFLSAHVLLNGRMGRGININLTLKCSFMVYSPL